MTANMIRDHHIVIDEQHMLPFRGDGRIVRGSTTHYFWYRARHNKWCMGVHNDKPTRNARCDVLEYDDAPVFHCADIKDTNIAAQQIDMLIEECVTSFLGPAKKYVSSPT